MATGHLNSTPTPNTAVCAKPVKLPFELFPGCSAVDSLSLQTDRRISDRHMRLALAYDTVNPLPKSASVRIVNVRPTRDIALTLLCDAMYRAFTLNGCVKRYDLDRTALPAQQVEELAPVAALQLADAMTEFTNTATAARCLDDDLVAA